ncbi:hypothetical protein C0993_002415 [Termitomyces sp. T159_Od127]|nr:hypothetical protein C0993_002415 [Termitomyces sp. T159_Od127]
MVSYLKDKNLANLKLGKKALDKNLIEATWAGTGLEGDPSQPQDEAQSGFLVGSGPDARGGQARYSLGRAKPAVPHIRILREVPSEANRSAEDNTSSRYKRGPSNMNQTLSPLKRDNPPFASSMGRIRKLLGDARFRHADPLRNGDGRAQGPALLWGCFCKTSERREWSSSTTSGTSHSAAAARYFNHLESTSSTVPCRTSQNPALLRIGDMRLSLQSNPMSGTVASPVLVFANLGTVLQQENFLFQNLAYAASLRLMIHSIQNIGSSGTEVFATPLIFSPSRVSGHSQAPPVPSNSPTIQASSRLLAGTDRLRPSSVASHAAIHAPPPTNDTGFV